ncbi:MAG: hypothetical protein JWM95_1653 [Gemmatimonadetes bacterium]|nr:hypothetical protein [Gemmatimonadota bacterium]
MRCALPLALIAWTPTAPPLDDALLTTARVAWEAGQYPDALRAMLHLLDGNTAERNRRDIALITGELYRSDSLAADGAGLRQSADGRWVAWQSGAGNALVTTIASQAGVARRRFSIRGRDLAFAPDGRTAVQLRVPPSAEADSLRRLIAHRDSLDDGPGMAAAEAALSVHEGRRAHVVRVDLESGKEQEIIRDDLEKSSPILVGTTNRILCLGRTSSDRALAIYELLGDGSVTRRSSGAVEGTRLVPTGNPRYVLVTGADTIFSVFDATSGRVRALAGRQPALSRDGSSVAYIARANAMSQVSLLSLHGETVMQDSARIVYTSRDSIERPVPSPDGTRVVIGRMPAHDWELYVVEVATGASTRITRDLQHDRLPQWLDENSILATKGETRHRRSYLYELTPQGATSVRVFHNNTVRTIAPEYEWLASPDGTRIYVVADRDGDTVSPEQSVYVVDRRREVSIAELRARVVSQLASELALRDRSRRMFAPIAGHVRDLTRRASIERLYGYQKALFDFDSKHVTQPGNLKAQRYLADTYRSFGYSPVLQEFTVPAGSRTANVIATLRGTERPDVIYVLASHYDSRAEGPGADDNTSGTAVLLETARLLAGHPLPATVVFASLSAEEGGLYGSAEFTRRAQAAGWNVAGAINNDMLGWSGDERLDNTIRYTNARIRDVQHAAALSFSRLITYDARYYKNTDAQAMFDAWGNVIGGMGSYPVLANPHYHKSHDVLETVNQQLVLETTRATVATMMQLASTPPRRGRRDAGPRNANNRRAVKE